jgi:hypothetical protein
MTHQILLWTYSETALNARTRSQAARVKPSAAATASNRPLSSGVKSTFINSVRLSDGAFGGLPILLGCFSIIKLPTCRFRWVYTPSLTPFYGPKKTFRQGRDLDMQTFLVHI